MYNKISSGKVRDIYRISDDKLLICTSDRISAFDVVLPTLIPQKGIILNKIAEFWFDFTKDIVPNHMITTDSTQFPEPFRQSDEFNNRSMLAKKLMMLPFEFIVRGYVSGNLWKAYVEKTPFCDIVLKDGLVESEKLDKPIFTPSTKNDKGHDEYIPYEVFKTSVGSKLAKKIKDICIELYVKCDEYANQKGIIIADTKFEFGLDENGDPVLADEIFTPDSSRFWDLESYAKGRPQDSFDKQFLRDWLTTNKLDGVILSQEIPSEIVNETRSKYFKAYKMLTGKELVF